MTKAEEELQSAIRAYDAAPKGGAEEITRRAALSDAVQAYRESLSEPKLEAFARLAEMPVTKTAPAAAVGVPKPVVRIYAEDGILVIVKWLDGARDLPDGDHNLFASPAPPAATEGGDYRLGWAAGVEALRAEIAATAPHGEAQPRTGTVADYSDDNLLGRAVQQPSARAMRQPAWARISDVFALGSTYSKQLCIRFGVDPETGKRIAASARSQQAGGG